MITNYKILGSDGKEYGPLDFGQINQWITEKRVDRQTPVFRDGARDWAYLEAVPEFAAVFAPAAPPVLSAPAGTADSGGGLNALIPYKNVRALIAYYFGVFSAIPLLGLPLGFVAFTLGIFGLRFRRQNPAAGGAVHAWIGIVAGGFFGLLWLGLIILGIAMASHRPHP